MKAAGTRPETRMNTTPVALSGLILRLSAEWESSENHRLLRHGASRLTPDEHDRRDVLTSGC